MKRICALIALLWLIFVFCPSLGLAQSEKEGIVIFKEAQELQKKGSSKKDLEKALVKFQQALGMFNVLKSEKWEEMTLSHIGSVYFRLSQYERSLEYYEKALAIHRKIGNVQMQGNTLTQVGKIYERLGQYQKALESDEKALDIHRRSGNAQMEGVNLSDIGLVYVRLDQYQKALEYDEKALDIHRKTRSLGGETNSLTHIGMVYSALGQYQKALEYHQKALHIRETAAGDMMGEGYSLSNIGEIYANLGQYQKALDCHEKALELHRKIGNVQGEGSSLSGIGATYAKLGQYQKALDYNEKALDLRRKIGDMKFEAVSWAEIGRLYHSWGQRQKALECYEKALEITRRIGSQSGEANNQTDIGRVYFEFAKYDDALKSFQNALEITNKIGRPTASIKSLIAWTYMENGELNKAAEVLIGADSGWALGKLHLLRFEYEGAKPNYEHLLIFAEKSRNVDMLFTAYTGLAECYEGSEDYKKAEEYYEKGMNLTEEMRSGLLPSERKNFFEVKVNGFQRSEPAKGLTRVRMKLNQAAGSIDSSEVTRARSFSDNISQRSESGNSGIPKNILEKEDELVSKVAALKKELAKTDKEKQGGRYENLSQEIQDAEKDLKAFVEMLWAKYKPYASVKYPRPVTLKESALKPEECVVIFDVSGEGVGVKLIKGKEIAQTFYTKWKSEDLEKDVKKFRQAFEEATLKEFDPALGLTFYKKLLSPVLGDVQDGTPLIIIPDGILAILPFEALVVSGKPTWKEDASGPYPEGITYLGDAYPISYYQSITSLTLARTLRSKEKPGTKTLVIADPVFEADDARLKNASHTERQKVLASLPEKLMSIKDQCGITFPRLSKTTELAESLKKLNPDKTDLFTGMQAKKSILFDKPLTDYGSIVFATHGYFGDDIPGIREPILAMTLVDQPKDQDGFVRMTEVMGMKLNADVVALTACQTGLGNNLAGEGVMSMGKAFQYAGAKSILMSLWSVSESGSVLLVEKFFEHLKAGKNKLDALKTAREDVRNGGYKHPFYWASFILVGEVN